MIEVWGFGSGLQSEDSRVGAREKGIVALADSAQ